MVKIRYSELPAGLHVSAKSHGGDTIIYLQPGLTADQRRAALIRVRSSARMGRGPTLSAAGMALAVGADRLRTTVRNGAAAMRGHPLLLLPPLILLVSSAIVFVLMSFVTLTVRQHEHPVAQNPSLVLPTSHQHGRGSGTGSGPRSARPAADPGTSGPGTGAKGGPAPGQTPSPSSSGPNSGLSSTPPASPTSGAPTPTPTPDPSPSPSQSQSGTCLKLGPLGLCLHL